METGLLSRPTFGGLASGLDTNALLEGLLAIERIPLQRIESRRSEISNQRSLMRDLNTKLLALRDAAREIDNRTTTGGQVAPTEEFLRYSGSTTNDEVVTISADSGAAPGDIDIRVDSLARGSRRFSVATAAGATALSGTQTLTIDLPNGDLTATPVVEATSITIEANGTDLTLQDIRDQINTSADNGGNVRADVLQISEDEFQLVITSAETGLSNELSIGGDLGFEAPALDGSDSAADASFLLFGRSITRESNLITDVLSGITLRLIAEAELEDDNVTPIIETVSVEVDVDEVAKGLEKFVAAYNDVVSFMDSQFRVDESTNRSGPLAGDFTLRDVQRQLREIVSTGYSFETNPSNPFASTVDGAFGGAISGIGIEIGSGGTLSINKEKLEEALALDPLSVREFLTGRERATPLNQAEIDADPTVEPILYDQGFAQRVAAQLEATVRTGDGALANRDQAFADRLEEFDDSIARFERRLTLREETLIARFSSLEQIVSSLQSQQGFLTSLTSGR